MAAPNLLRNLLFAAVACAVPTPALSAEKPRTHALVSAVGSDIQWVRQNNSAGTHIPYQRHTINVPNVSIDAAALRGLDRAVASDDPDAQRVFLRLAPEMMRDLRGHERSEVLPARAMAALRAVPERETWDRIYLLTPRFFNDEREGMGAKLHGIGVYVQPLRRNTGVMGDSGDLDTSLGYETVSPKGEKRNSDTFVAPYFYTQLWIIDAKSMKVLEKKERYDYQRINDPDSNEVAIDQLAVMMEKFVERAAARAVNEQTGEVTVKEPRVINPAEIK
jgi:hypothetical protein